MKSNRGNKYVMVAYVYDPNAILVEPMKNRKENEIIRAYGVNHHQLQQYGFKPRYQMLDNKASTAFQANLSAKKIDFQLVPPNTGNHRRNATERAIETFKKHFMAGLFSRHPNFPMQLWCRVQAELTLNLLRPSRLNPKLSAYAQLEGAFDFNRTPLVPLGVKMLVYETPSQRGSWSPHGVEGWYIGPAMRNYRCYVLATASERTAETVSFFHVPLLYQKKSSIYAAIIAVHDLTYALTHPDPASPTMILGDEETRALQQLSDIFETNIKQKEKNIPSIKIPPILQPTQTPLEWLIKTNKLLRKRVNTSKLILKDISTIPKPRMGVPSHTVSESRVIIPPQLQPSIAPNITPSPVETTLDNTVKNTPTGTESHRSQAKISPLSHLWTTNQ